MKKRLDTAVNGLGRVCVQQIMQTNKNKPLPPLLKFKSYNHYSFNPFVVSFPVVALPNGASCLSHALLCCSWRRQDGQAADGISLSSLFPAPLLMSKMLNVNVCGQICK